MTRHVLGWHTLRRAGIALLVVAGTVLPLGLGQGGGKKSDVEVKASVKAEQPGADGKQTLNLTLTINKGWHIYANPVGNEDFAPNATVVTVKPKPRAIEVVYPSGKLKKDSIAGESVEYRIYEDRVTIPIQIQRAAGDTSALELNVRINVCNDKGRCLPTSTIKVAVK